MYFFFVGTEAELIKIFPIMLEMNKREIKYKIIASGQNDLTKSRVLKQVNSGHLDLELSHESDIKKSALGLLLWYIKTSQKAKGLFKNSDFMVDINSVMIVHGDTVSTVMGAYLGRKLGMKVAHIEAGLRSHNYFDPFPEEIDRALVTRVADYSFAPGDEAECNLKKSRGFVVNTSVNTLCDSLKYSRDMETLDTHVAKIVEGKAHNPYFVFVMHRQENIANTKFFNETLDIVLKKADHMHLVIILHKITENKLVELGRLKDLENNLNISLLPRVDYFDFMKLLDNSEFVITDGGSNQEELSYMGKPCFIVRKSTERNEGIGENAILLGDGNISMLENFVDNYVDYIREPQSSKYSPSKEIVDVLEGHKFT